MTSKVGPFPTEVVLVFECLVIQQVLYAVYTEQVYCVCTFLASTMNSKVPPHLFMWFSGHINCYSKLLHFHYVSWCHKWTHWQNKCCAMLSTIPFFHYSEFSCIPQVKITHSNSTVPHNGAIRSHQISTPVSLILMYFHYVLWCHKLTEAALHVPSFFHGLDTDNEAHYVNSSILYKQLH